jgi:hypothetical protein
MSTPMSDRPHAPPPISDRSHTAPMSDRSAPPSMQIGRPRPQGCLWRVTRWLEARHGAFMISRLILMTGIKLRDFDAASPDNPDDVRALERALRTLLTPDELNEIEPLLWARG